MTPRKRRTLMSRTSDWFGEVFRHRMLKDRLFLVFILVAVALCLIIVVAGAIKLRPQDMVVPLQYSSIQGFNVLGEWYRNLIFPFFSLLITTGNLYLALKSFDKSRMASFFLILGTVLVNILILVVFLVLMSHIEA